MGGTEIYNKKRIGLDRTMTGQKNDWDPGWSLIVI